MSQAATQAVPTSPGVTVPTLGQIENLIVARLAAAAGRGTRGLRTELRSAHADMPVDPEELRAILPEILTHFGVELKDRDLTLTLYYVAELARAIHRELSRATRRKGTRKRPPPAAVHADVAAAFGVEVTDGDIVATRVHVSRQDTSQMQPVRSREWPRRRPVTRPT